MIFAVGIIVVGLAAALEAIVHPPPFVHLLIWIPAVIALSLGLLRPFKATLVALQYRNNAHPGVPR